MRAFHYLPIAAFCLMAASCNTGKQQAELTAGIQLANLDTTALPEPISMNTHVEVG